MLVTLTYGLMLGFLLTHELDAMRRHEWRVLPLTSFLPDDTGRRVFVWAHVPLVAALFAFGGDPASGFAAGVSIFAIIHVGLHWLFRTHPANEFKTTESWALILGAGGFGLVHLLARL